MHDFLAIVFIAMINGNTAIIYVIWYNFNVSNFFYDFISVMP